MNLWNDRCASYNNLGHDIIASKLCFSLANQGLCLWGNKHCFNCTWGDDEEQNDGLSVRNIWVSKDEAANNDPVLRLTHNNCILLPLRRKRRVIWRIWSVSYEKTDDICHFFQHVTTQTFNQKGLLNRLNSYWLLTFVWLWWSNQQRCNNVMLIHFSITISKKRFWCLIWQNVEKLNTLYHKVCLFKIK